MVVAAAVLRQIIGALLHPHVRVATKLETHDHNVAVQNSIPSEFVSLNVIRDLTFSCI
jgi:hypothetical protein